MKACRCGRRYNADAWMSLRHVGIQDGGDGLYLELRDCECGSTIAVEIAP